MDLTLSPEDEMLEGVALDFAASIRPAQPQTHPGGSDPGAWQRLADMGLLGLGTATESGGGGGTWLQASLVVSSFARNACNQPYFGCGVLAPALLAAAGADAELMKAIVAGSPRIGLALDPSLSRLACVDDDEEAVGFDCDGADSVLVLTSRNPNRLGLANTAQALDSVDLTRAMLRVELLGQTPRPVGGVISTDEMERWEAKALTAIAADLVGTMDGAIELSVGHAKLRSQFGVPIGSFQAIQHLIADQFVTYEGATWVVRHAAWCADELATTEALVAARTGKAYTSGRARGVAESTIQVLGGTGFLWESWAHVYLRRAILGSVALGNEDHQALEIAISRSKG